MQRDELIFTPFNQRKKGIYKFEGNVACNRGDLKMNDRRSLTTKIGLGKTLIIVISALIPALANALIITLEPDDYGLGVPLQNEYVSVGETGGSPYDSPVIRPLTAKNPGQVREGYEAPTGELTFGNYPFVRPSIAYNWAGIVFDFNQAVSQVTLLAKSLEAMHGGASWVAFDYHGNVIQSGNVRSSDGRYVPYEVKIPLENVWRVI